MCLKMSVSDSTITHQFCASQSTAKIWKCGDQSSQDARTQQLSSPHDQKAPKSCGFFILCRECSLMLLELATLHLQETRKTAHFSGFFSKFWNALSILRIINKPYAPCLQVNWTGILGVYACLHFSSNLQPGKSTIVLSIVFPPATYALYLSKSWRCLRNKSLLSKRFSVPQY